MDPQLAVRQPHSSQKLIDIDVQMLQHEIMFKQLKELHGRHQLQELGDTRNQDYVNQLSSLKQASAVQFASRVNRAPVRNSQMFTAGNMQMMQRDGSGVLQQLSNGLILSQSYNHASGPMGVPLPESDINLNLYSHLQGRSNHSATLLTKNDNSPLEISAMHPSAFASSLMSQQGNISDQISISDGPWQPNEVFQENYLFAQVPVHSLNSDILSLTDSRQGITMFRNTSALESEGRHVDTGAHGSSSGKVSNASLDPLEQKILYNTNDGSWGFSFGRSNKTGTGDSENTVENQFCMDTFPSIQSGSWTALMHSAVAETSSPDTAIQDEWSGLSFQKPEQSTDNQLSNFTTSENQQTDWTEKNLQNIVPPSSEPEQLFQISNVNCGFPGSHALGYESRGTLWLHRSTSNSASNGIHQPFNQVDRELQDFSVNQLNIQRYSVESEKMVPGDNVELMSDLLGASRGLHGQAVTAQSDIYAVSGWLSYDLTLVSFFSSDILSALIIWKVGDFYRSESMLQLLNKDDLSNDHAPEIQLNSKVSSYNDLPLTENSVASFAKLCNNSPMSQGLGFRLKPSDAGTPQQCLSFPSLLMGNATAFLPSHCVSDYIKDQLAAPPVSSHMTAKFPAYSAVSSQVNPQLKSVKSGGPEFPFLENVAAMQPSRASAVSQHFELPIALSTSWPYITTQEDVPSPKPSRCSANLFHSPDSASCIQEASSGAPNEQHNQKCSGNKHNIQEFGTCSGKSEYHELPLERSFSLHEDSTELHNPISVSRTTHRQESFRMHQSEADRVAAGSMMSCTFQQPSSQAKQKDNGTPVLPARDIRAFAHSLHQNYSLLHQMHSREAAYQQVITNGRELLLSGEKLAVNDKAKSNLEEVQLGAISLGDQSGKALSASPQNFQQKEMFNQNGSESCSNSNEVSNAAYQSQISLQMAPYGTLNNVQMWPMYIPKPAINAGQPFSGLTIGNLQENSFIMQVTSANTSQGVPKKRKSVAFDMLPWNKEVNEEPLRLQNISISELEWAEASNIRPQEAQKEAEIVEEIFPVVRAKRRLIFTTQIMQQVFRPAPVVILLGDARSNCDYVAYSVGRLALGDACNWTNKLPSDTKNASPDKPKTSRRISACDLSKAVEGLISRVAKLESDLSRLDRSLSIVDIKIESQEVEKFSTYNRFAKFHVKAGPSTVDPASSSGPSTVQKTRPQPYVIALPMLGTIPEGSDCLSL
ncbi:hypothetical protein Sango_1789500 [Sesamum angolense]|uniref:Uncharacterized protein n=1 Tax=Sesamum angolense TaxID=2727404 RepID=A0AAE1WH21_9LAMI|nr:hypothetical protein Sango_1789500 [Sesamum angolense]